VRLRVNRNGAPDEAAAGFVAGRVRQAGKCGTAFGLRGQRGRWAGEEGSSLVEFAVSIPVLLTFFFGLIQVCIATYTRGEISESAREGTRYAMVHGSSCLTASSASCTLNAQAINTYVSSGLWPNIGGGTMTVNTTYPDGNESPGSHVQVQVTYAFPFRVPFIPASTLTMSSTSVMYIVQ
jgi:Flp pilus assembly protein TadG